MFNGEPTVKKSELTDIGLSDDIAERVMSLHNDAIKNNYIPKSRFDEVNEAKKSAELMLKERDNQLDVLKKSSADVGNLQKEISRLQDENKSAEKNYRAKLESLKLDNAIEMELMNFRAKNTRAVRALIDIDRISLGDDGKVVGLEDQIKSILESDPYLFANDGDRQSVAKITGFIPADGRSEAPNPSDITFQSRLENARKNNDTLAAISIKQEANAAGVTLF